MSKKFTGKRKDGLSLRKETFGEIPLEDCLKMALEPYFKPEKHDEPYLKRIG